MGLEKIKKIYRILFPAKYTVHQVAESIIRRSAIVKNHEVNFFYEVELRTGLRLRIRDGESSDIQVFDQIFNKEEYRPVLNLIRLNQANKREKIIIDAGANVGYTSVFFLQNFKNVKIYSVEPSPENAGIYRYNTSSFTNQVHLYNSALCGEKNQKFTLERHFRDGKDWALCTEESRSGEIPGITLNEIIAENDLTYISILKIDIEGAERFIFHTGSNLSFLEITELLAIEIHDEFRIRDQICELLREKRFYILETGELTIAINSQLF